MARGRAGNGSGNVVYHKDKKKPYQIQFTVDGKRKSGGYYATHAEAMTALRKVTSQVDSKDYIDPQRMLLSEWMAVWMDEYCTDVKASTMAQYEGYVVNHINPAIGKVKLCALQPKQVQGFVNNLTRKDKAGDKPLAYKTMKNIHGCLSSALEKAKEIHYIKDNPATGCAIPRSDEDSDKYEIRPLEGDQIPAFLEAVKGARFERIYIIALDTGMRLSEILGLQWDRVRERTNELRVSKQLTVKRKAGAKRVLTSTKTRNTRTIVVPGDVMELLAREKKDQVSAKEKAGSLWMNKDGLCFTDEMGDSISHTSVDHEYKRIVSSIGMPDKRFHDLRHTFATEAIRAGVDYETLSKHLGHFSVGFTLDVYGHVTDEMKREAAQKMQKVIDRRKGRSEG